MSYPGILTRSEFATGLLVRSVKINGDYLLVDECNINQTQNIDTNASYIQGGPGNSISFYDAKKISGSLSFPLRVDGSNNFELAAKTIINHAQNPFSVLSMDTNHILNHVGLTAENHATDNNQLLKIDNLIISSLSITCSQNDAVKINLNFEGMIDTVENSNLSIPNENAILGRALSWGDCDAYRSESSLRTINGFSIQITNNIETPNFLIPYQTPESGIASTRSDQIAFLGLSSVKWSGNYTEFVRMGSDLETFIHGGYMSNENLTFEIGSMRILFTNPLFKITQVPLTSNILTRTIEWSAVTKPKQPLIANSLITFN